MVNYFFKYNMNKESFTPIAFLCIFVPAALALPLWVAVSKQLSKKAAYNMGMGLLAVALSSSISSGNLTRCSSSRRFAWPGSGYRPIS